MSLIIAHLWSVLLMMNPARAAFWRSRSSGMSRWALALVGDSFQTEKMRATAVCGSRCCWKRASFRAYSLACRLLDMATRSVRTAATPGIILPLWSNVDIHLSTSVIVTPSFQACR